MRICYRVRMMVALVELSKNAHSLALMYPHQRSHTFPNLAQRKTWCRNWKQGKSR